MMSWMPEATHPIWELAAFAMRVGMLAGIMLYFNRGEITQSNLEMLVMFAMFGGGVDAMRARALKKSTGK